MTESRARPNTPATWKANAAGVDLNRNFDAGWAQLDEPRRPLV